MYMNIKHKKYTGGLIHIFTQKNILAVNERVTVAWGLGGAAFFSPHFLGLSFTGELFNFAELRNQHAAYTGLR